MKTQRISRYMLAGIFVLSIAAVSILNVFASRQGGTHSLVNASIEDVKKAALNYTRSRFQVMSKDITIPLARPVIKQELPNLGLPEIDFGGEDPPLALVVLKGEFDVRNMRHLVSNNAPWRVKFILYVFDLKAGTPTLIGVSTDGSMFRDLLNDPSLPTYNANVNQNWMPEEGIESPVPAAPATKLPYRATEPPAPTPTGPPPPTEP